MIQNYEVLEGPHTMQTVIKFMQESCAVTDS